MPTHHVGHAANLLKDGELKRFELEGKAVVVARVDGLYYAFGGDCTHYQAPLEKGVLKQHTLMCPWHHACFDIRSGTRLEPPALNDLPRYPVSIQAGELVVSLPEDNQTEPQGTTDSADGRQFVIVGGGAAGNAAAEALRRGGYTGQITLISAVSTVPIDRPNLSKDYLAGKAEADWMPLREAGWYAQRNIELLLNTTVTRIDRAAHKIRLDSGAERTYDKLLLATGGTPRLLTDVPGMALKGIFTLRSQADADAIIQAAHDKRLVLIGASFIAMEAAASLAERSLSTTIVGLEVVPFATVLGAEIGRLFQTEHEANGVQFRLNSGVEAFIGRDGVVTGVRLKGGEMLPADLILIGVGVRPATDFFIDSGLNLDEKDKSVLVNEQLQTNDPAIYAAGDIAKWSNGEGGTRIEHWRVAQQQGIVAAQQMIGQSDTITQHVPFFWTKQWKLDLRYVGHAEKWDEIIYRGQVQAGQFIAFYVAEGRLKAVAACQRDAEADALEFILRDDLPLTPEQMRDEAFDLIAYARA